MANTDRFWVGKITHGEEQCPSPRSLYRMNFTEVMIKCPVLTDLPAQAWIVPPVQEYYFY